MRLILLSLVLLLHLPALNAQGRPPVLGIEEVVQLALANQFDIRIGEIDLAQAEKDIAISRERFETRASASVSGFRDSNSNPQDFPFSAAGAQQSVEMDKTFSTGTHLNLSLNSTRFEDLEIPRTTEITAEFNQPILQGRSRIYNLAPVHIASRQYQLSREELRLIVLNTLANAQFAWFDGILATENLRVAEESLRLSRQLLEENQRRVELGSIATSDLLQAEAEVALRQEQVYQARVGLVDAKNRLRAILSQDTRGALAWDFTFRTIPPPQPREINLDTSFSNALELRPDYRQAVLGLEIDQIEELRRRNETLPQLDLFARLTFEGWGNNLSDSIEEALRNDRPDFVAGLRLSRSLSNNANRARRARAVLDLNRGEMTLQKLEQSILLDLDSAAARITANWNRLQAASTGRELAEKSLQAEQKRYQTGTSITFILIRLQSDLISARIRQLIAVHDYRRSIVEFERQTGELLQRHNVQL